MQTVYALHHINNQNNFGFSPTDYSQFKYGHGLIAKTFGQALALGFIQTHLQAKQINKQIVVVPSPYAFIPTATFALKNAFVNTLNSWLAANGHAVVQETKVHRTITYKEDYGELNAEQRLQLIGNDKFYIDAQFIKDKILLFLDDIKITGGHEKMITKMLNEFGINNETYLIYFAQLVDPSIPANIENHLNNFVVKNINNLDAIIQHPSFCINTRIVKYILNTEVTLFNAFIKRHSAEFLEQFYYMAIGNSYHTIDAYAQNVAYLAAILLKNKIINF
jgi:hypothetical protein